MVKTNTSQDLRHKSTEPHHKKPRQQMRCPAWKQGDLCVDLGLCKPRQEGQEASRQGGRAVTRGPHMFFLEKLLTHPVH